MEEAYTLEAVLAARARIAPHVRETPVLTSAALNAHAGCTLFFKCENFQKTGSFKARGACNAVLSLSQAEAARGVVTHSSGNHGQALAYAAGLRGIHARIVMPVNAPETKRAAALAYGAEIIACEATNAARQATADRVAAETGALFIHSSNDPAVICGQGTLALELLEQAPSLDLVLVPVGGGGLAGGVGAAMHGLRPETRVVGVEPAGADDAYRSLQEGRILPSLHPDTIADGLRTALGSHTFPLIQARLSEIVTVSDAAIVEAMRLIWQRMKIVIEPSAAVPLAGLLEGKVDAAGKRVGVVLSGGNVDLDALPWPALE